MAPPPWRRMAPPLVLAIVLAWLGDQNRMSWDQVREREAELLRWADTSGAWIVEGNFNDEITYDTQPPGTLWSLEESDRVLMMGTLEGIMFPALRLCYLVVPPHLVHVFTAMRGMLADSSNIQLQMALAWFIEEGHLAAHLRHLRRVGREHRGALAAACERHLPAWARLGPMNGGVVACIHVPPSLPDREVVRRMRERGVVAASMSSTAMDPAHGNGIVVSYGAFDAFTIERAIAVIGQCLREMAATPGYQLAGENR